MENKKLIEKNIQSKSWLQRLKDESWEAELLVSTIAIFGTFQLFDLINWSINRFINFLNPDQYLIGYYIVVSAFLAVSVLVSMFIIHFILRAYWIGLVGLNSVFPDYSIEDSAYSKIYTEKIVSILPKLKETIKKIDELCSVIFSAAFTLLFIYSYIAISSTIYLIIFNLLSKTIPKNLLLTPFILIFLLLILQSILTVICNLKRNKEKRNLQIFYFKIVKLTSFITYGPLYKTLLQVTMIFGSNFKKKKSLAYLLLSFIFVGFVLFGFKSFDSNLIYLVHSDYFFDNTKAYPNYYKTENENQTFLLAPEIESDKIETKILKVFIPVFIYETNLRDKMFGELKSKPNISQEQERKERAVYLLNNYKKYIHLYLNDKKIEVDFLRHDSHAKTNQLGLVCYMDLSDLKTGIQTLEIKKEFKDIKISNWTIPFYYVSKN